MENNLPHISLSGYMPSGARVFFTIPLTEPMNAYAEAKAFTDKLLADGLLLNEPRLEPGEDSEIIVTVMRRAKPSDDTPIIDFYPEWKPGGDEPFGTYKYLHLYLNNPDDVNAFLQVSGFKSLDSIPLYDGQAPLKRVQGKPNPKETRVPTPFRIVRKQGAERVGSDDKPYRPWELVRYEAISQPAPQPTQPTPSATVTPEPAQNGATGQPEGSKGKKEFDWTIIYNNATDDQWEHLCKVCVNQGFYEHLSYARNSVRKLETDGKINPEMTLGMAFNVIRAHHLEKVAQQKAAATAEGAEKKSA